MVFAAVLAGGVGSRMGANTPKQYLRIGGRTILSISVSKFLREPEITHVVVLTPGDWVDYTRDLLAEEFGKTDRLTVLEGGETRNETVMNAIRHMIEIDRDLMERSVGRSSAARVAVIAEGGSMYRVRKSSPLATVTLNLMRPVFAQMGAPYDLYSIGDLAEPCLGDYDFYIFLNAYAVTTQTRRRIDAVCRRPGKTILWLYAPDYAGEGEMCADRISAMTGIRVREQAEDPGSLLWEDQPITAANAPHFVIDDPDCTVAARFEDGSAAVA